MPLYTLLLHMKPNTEGVRRAPAAVAKLITDRGGVVRRLNNSGTRPLPMVLKGTNYGERFPFADIVSVEFMAKPSLLPDIKFALLSQPDTLRYSFLRCDETLLKPPPRVTQDMRETPVLPPFHSSYAKLEPLPARPPWERR
jgi:ribosomal protein S6